MNAVKRVTILSYQHLKKCGITDANILEFKYLINEDIHHYVVNECFDRFEKEFIGMSVEYENEIIAEHFQETIWFIKNTLKHR